MRSTRSELECAEVLYAALRDGEPFTRKRLVECGILSGHDFGRARKILADAGVIETLNKQGYVLRIHRLGGPPERAAPLSLPRKTACDRFGGLLSAWQIRLPVEPVGTTRCINRRFLREDTQHEGGFDEHPALSLVED